MADLDIRDLTVTFRSTMGTLGFAEDIYDEKQQVSQQTFNENTKKKIDDLDASLAECAKKTDIDSLNAKIDSLPKEWIGIQEEYDALTSFNENTKYYIV